MRYDISEYEIKSNKIQRECCVALLADIHDMSNEAIVVSLREKQPSIICIAGDIVSRYIRKHFDSHDCFHRTIDFLGRCVEIAPTYFSLGNHEMAVPSKQINDFRETGIVILDNEYVTLSDNVLIGGLSAAARSYDSPEYEWLSDFQGMDGFKILMSHRPEYFCLCEPKLADRPIDLVFSGHAHGGQIRIGGRGIYAPGQGLFPKYTSGCHKGHYGQIIISMGLSNTTYIPRFGNRPEIVYVKIKPLT